MTSHTPGPWLYQALAGNHDFAVYTEATGHDVALVRNFNEPNARLIAASPRLLAALKELVARCDGEAGILADGSNINTWQAHAAIEEAEGRAA